MYIHHIETLTPRFEYNQAEVGEKLAADLQDPRTARMMRVLSRTSGIERRYSVLPDYLDGQEPVLFRRDANGRRIEPGTQERNQCFIRNCSEMSVEIARRAVENAEGFSATDITHVITVSCTGFYSPGADFQIVTALGLPESTERYHLGFMGCYAAVPALKMARQFCMARPDAVVLVVCIELCTLHLQVLPETDNLLANTLFADGAAAAIVSSREPAASRPALAMEEFASALAPEGKGDMAWVIGDSGFNMVLSSYVPDIIGANVARIMADLFSGTERCVEEVDLWAIHPGGKLILDKVEKALGFAPEQIEASRSVLRDYGNMSSATVLFVLKRLLDQATAPQRTVCAMAFGPGLTVETLLAELLPARTATDETPGIEDAGLFQDRFL